LLAAGSWCGENRVSAGNKEGLLQIGVEASSR